MVTASSLQQLFEISFIVDHFPNDRKCFGIEILQIGELNNVVCMHWDILRNCYG